MAKTVFFQTIQFSISTQFSSIWPIDRTLSGATTTGLSGPGSNSNEGILHILQSSCITGDSPSDCLVSYAGHSLGEGLTPLQRSRQCILQPYSTGLGKQRNNRAHIDHSKDESGKPDEIYCKSDFWLYVFQH